jgi:hypothetical protein
MPYLRLYSRYAPIEQKGIVTQKLIEVTLRTLHLCPEDRNRITVQFIPPPQVSGADVSRSVIPRGADFMLEVMAHHLTEANERAFAEEAVAMLAQLLPAKARSRTARLLGIRPDPPRRVALQFDELSPAISDPFILVPEPRAA